MIMNVDFIKQHWRDLLFLYLICLITFYFFIQRHPLILVFGSLPAIIGMAGQLMRFVLVGEVVKEEADLNNRSIWRQLWVYVGGAARYIFLPSLIITAILLLIAYAAYKL